MNLLLQNRILIHITSIAVMIGSNVAFSQQDLALEEVIVTAQKREQSLQDVPVSITAVAGEGLRANSIEKLEVLAQMLPSLHVSEAFGGDIVTLRGLGPGNNPGHETSVGTQVDGFYYGRSRLGRLQFLDLERVELLKGPQGAIIGKNNTAGAINITTARPTDELEGYVTFSEEFEGAEGETYEGAISGPVIGESLKARLALRYENKDGYLNNTATGGNDQSRDDISGRLSLLFEPSQFENFNALIQYSFAEINRSGRHLQVLSCSPALLGFIAANAIDEDCTLNTTRSTTDTRAGVPGNEFQRTDADTLTATLNWELENFTISSLTGYTAYDFVDTGNTSYTNTEAAFFVDIEEDYEHFTQEFRIISNQSQDFAGQSLDYIAGVYYQDNQIDSLVRLSLPSTSLGGMGPNVTRLWQAFQDGMTAAVFGQLEWHVNDNWDVAFEARYTYEEKDGRHVQFPSVLFGNDQVPGPGAGGPAGVFNEHDVADKIRESDFSPGLTIMWHPQDEWMFYGSLKKGFKSSGFDHNLGGTQAAASDGRFTYDNEDVVAGELGGKITLADGAVRVNVSLFRNEFDNLQRTTLVDTATFVVGNAASAVTQGFEADMQWRLTDALTVSASGLLLDATYDTFTTAGCTAPQILALGGSMSTEGANCTQDLSGKDLEYAADYYFNFGAEYVWPISDRLDLTSYVMVYGEGEKFLAGDLDPNVLQDAFAKVDARLTLADSDRRWNISLIARNLGDEQTAGFANDINQFGAYFGMADPPRTLVLQGSMRF